MAAQISMSVASVIKFPYIASLHCHVIFIRRREVAHGHVPHRHLSERTQRIAQHLSMDITSDSTLKCLEDRNIAGILFKIDRHWCVSPRRGCAVRVPTLSCRAPASPRTRNPVHTRHTPTTSSHTKCKHKLTHLTRFQPVRFAVHGSGV